MSDSVRFSDGRRKLLLSPLALLTPLQYPPEMQDPLPNPRHDEVRLPNGKKQSDEILKAEFKKNLEDVRELSELTRSLQQDIERDDRFVLSLGTLKKLDDVEKLTKRIRSRLKRF